MDLRCLVDPQPHRVVRRIEVESPEVPDVLEEEGIGGQLEGLRQMRLEA